MLDKSLSLLVLNLMDKDRSMYTYYLPRDIFKKYSVYFF